jgi:hypothetical protein
VNATMDAPVVASKTEQAAAWQRIVDRAEADIAAMESAPPVWNMFFGEQSGGKVTLKSINDEVQAEYKTGRIAEVDRDAMRKFMARWFGSQHLGDSVKWAGNERGYDAYSCGLWAGAASPWNLDELYFIHMTLVIFTEEARAEAGIA